MKKFKFLFIVLILSVILGATFIVVDKCKEYDDFVPVLRFAIASDVHVADNGSEVEEKRLASLFDIAYNYSRNNNTRYKKLDGVIFAGDFTNLGTLYSMQKFKDIVDNKIKPETKLVVSLGNHEFYSDASMAESRYKTVFKNEVDEHFILSGFHFIKLSPSGEYFSEAKLSWLRAELEKASTDTPNKPIFVIQHQHVKNTVYGSTGWGADGLYEILSDYPQVVDFSGHSHFPIQDERSLWQGDFTAIGTGTVSYVEMGLNGVSTDYVFPDGRDGYYQLNSRTGNSDYGVFQIVECDKNGNVRLIGYEISSGIRLFKRKIATVNKDQFVTNDTKKLITPIPEFETGSRCEFIKDGCDGGIITIPQAKSDAFIESYRIDLYHNDSLFNTYYALSGQIFMPPPKSISIRLTGLEVGKSYFAKVYAVNAYGVASTMPIEFSIVF